MTDRMSLGQIDPDQFDRLISLLMDWVSSDSVRIRVNPSTIGPFDVVSFKFEEDEVTEQLEEHQLPKTCVSQLRFDVPLMLFGVLSGQRNYVTRIIADHESPEDETDLDFEKIRNEISARTKIIEEKIADAKLRRQYAIKNTANNPIFLDSSWEVLEKKNADGGPPLSNLIFANLRIQVQKPTRGGSVESHFVFGVPGFDSLTVTMTPEDIRDLSESINNLMNAMNQANPGESEQ